MNLTLYFRLICMSIFQLKNEYDNVFFFCPPVHAKDGFKVSLQINHGNYCSSENGYRKLGHTWESVEFGFTSVHEPLMSSYSEDPGDTTISVGSVPVSVMEEVFEKHGGIDWEKTLSKENFQKFIKK